MLNHGGSIAGSFLKLDRASTVVGSAWSGSLARGAFCADSEQLVELGAFLGTGAGCLELGAFLGTGAFLDTGACFLERGAWAHLLGH